MIELVDFLSQHGIDYREGGTHKHVRVGWVGVDCPRCGPGSGKFHAGVQMDLGRAACWRCGGFRPFQLLQELTGIPWWQIRNDVAPDSTRVIAPGNRLEGGQALKLPNRLERLHGPYRRYVKDRGLDSELIENLWEVKATGPLGRLSWRLWIPIHLDGRVVSWTTRAIADGRTRYISARPEEELVSHKHLLYGEDLAEQAVVVVEGPIDVWAIGPGAVAILGLQTTPQQIARIGRHPVRAICCDNERAAQRRAENLADLLQCYPGDTYVVRLETGKDAAEADPKELEELRCKYLGWTRTASGV